MTIYREDDRIDYEARAKYAKMTAEEREALIKKYDAELKAKFNK